MGSRRGQVGNDAILIAPGWIVPPDLPGTSPHLNHLLDVPARNWRKQAPLDGLDALPARLFWIEKNAPGYSDGPFRPQSFCNMIVKSAMRAAAASISI